MSPKKPRRVLKVLLTLLAAGIVILGIRAWQVVAPVLGWSTPSFDTEAPLLPQGLEDAPLAVLHFSRTAGFRHEEAIPAAAASLEAIARRNGWALYSTENGAIFNAADLARFDVIFGNNITGPNWDEGQKSAFIAWIEDGGGFVGVHGAAGTRYRYWDWYTDSLLGGARFIGHPVSPHLSDAGVIIEDPQHITVAHFGPSFRHEDEWYSFEASARAAGSHVLATLDEASYGPDDDLAMGEDHPIIWIACPGKGRSFYSALGHTAATYARPDHARMLEEAIRWAADRNADCP